MRHSCASEQESVVRDSSFHSSSLSWLTLHHKGCKLPLLRSDPPNFDARGRPRWTARSPHFRSPSNQCRSLLQRKHRNQVTSYRGCGSFHFDGFRYVGSGRRCLPLPSFGQERGSAKVALVNTKLGSVEIGEENASIPLSSTLPPLCFPNSSSYT